MAGAIVCGQLLFLTRRNGLIHDANAGTFLVWIHSRPWPENLQTKPSPEKNSDLYPPILVTLYFNRFRIVDESTLVF